MAEKCMELGKAHPRWNMIMCGQSRQRQRKSKLRVDVRQPDGIHGKELGFNWRMDVFWQTQNTSVSELSVYGDTTNKNILKKQKSGPKN